MFHCKLGERRYTRRWTWCADKDRSLDEMRVGNITGAGSADKRGLNWVVLAQLWGVGFCAAAQAAGC